MINKIKKKFAFLLFCTDTVFFIASINIAPMIRFNDYNTFYFSLNDYQIYLVIIIFYSVFFIFDLYNIMNSSSYVKYFFDILIAFIIIYILNTSLFYMLPGKYFGRGIWALQLGIFFISVIGTRFPLLLLYHKKLRKKKILFIGKYEGDDDLIRIIDDHSYTEYVGFVNGINVSLDDKNEYNYMGPVKDLNQIIKKYKIDALVIVDKVHIKADLERIILNWKMKGVQVFDVPGLVESFKGKLPVDVINHFWIIFNTFKGINHNLYNDRIKRIIDIVISFFSLVGLSPLIIFFAILIKLTSKGPIFYKQIRVGKNEKVFQIIKFRSMRHDAEKNGAVWASKNDFRVTFIGKIIRKVRIDELPQLLNVLKGEMTLVGPRPERPEFVDILKNEIPYYSLRHMIKPGITGWAQVKYPYGATVEEAKEKLKYDLFYMRRVSLKLDVIIMLRTIKTVLFGSGAR